MKAGDKAIITEYRGGFLVGTEVTLVNMIIENYSIWNVEKDGKVWAHNEEAMKLVEVPAKIKIKKPSLIKRFMIWLLTPLMEDYTSTHFRDKYFESRAKASKV